MVAKTESSAIKEQKTKSHGNGEGTFYYVESKKLWAGQFVILFQKTGASKWYMLYGKTKTAVKKEI